MPKLKDVLVIGICNLSISLCAARRPDRMTKVSLFELSDHFSFMEYASWEKSSAWASDAHETARVIRSLEDHGHEDNGPENSTCCRIVGSKPQAGVANG